MEQDHLDRQSSKVKINSLGNIILDTYVGFYIFLVFDIPNYRSLKMLRKTAEDISKLI